MPHNCYAITYMLSIYANILCLLEYFKRYMLRSDIYSTGKLIVFLLVTWKKALKFLLQPIENVTNLTSDIENLCNEEKELIEVIQHMLHVNPKERQKISNVIRIFKELQNKNIVGPEHIFDNINLPPSKDYCMSERTVA